MILVIDNYDSFTYNLVQYLGELDPLIEVHLNDRISVEEVEARRPDHLVISPGPCTPTQAGICLDLLRRLSPRIPTLGVCLGHQAIGQAFGGEVVRAPQVMHGKTSHVIHDETGLFEGLENPFEATRYHSLVIAPESLPDCLKVTARTPDHVIMGVRHKSHPIHGVQFHPESILTKVGKRLLANFLTLYRRDRGTGDS
ncbi:MAG: aminodeoxychorismate/anthranilate synthase component II [Candidatus Riflebacteria bacterium]|nr:aminodeoxychorismate/anthranilate synthase component II [Candidatus Riflebacteria bacterium]